MSFGNKGYGLPALGVINALGRGKKAIWEALLNGDQDHFATWHHPVDDREIFVAEISGELPEVPQSLKQHRSRNNQLTLAAFEEISTEVNALITRYGAERIGILLGSSTSGIREGDYALEHFDKAGDWPDWYHLSQQEMGCAASFLSAYLETSGPSYTVSTACSSSAKVFASARNLLNANMCDAVIVGGTDSLCRLTISGFSALDAVSKSRCNSMSVNRDGLLIGEASALFIMERETRGRAPSLLGVGESSDAYHMSAPHPQGHGAEAAMRAAIDDAGLSASDILYVNLHGTATQHNDAMESEAVNRLFGQEMPCSSTKPMTGHTLGAAGATEAAFCWLMLQNASDVLSTPPHCYDNQYDPALPKLHLTTSDQTIPWPGQGAVLSNSFAFGGNNCSLVLGRPA